MKDGFGGEGGTEGQEGHLRGEAALEVEVRGLNGSGSGEMESQSHLE